MNGKRRYNIVDFYTIVIIILIAIAIILLLDLSLYIAPKILDIEIGRMPIDYNSTYPSLLQGVIIAAGIIAGLFGGLVIGLAKRLTAFIKKYRIKNSPQWLTYSLIIIAALLLFIFTILSIFYSINSMINFSVVNSYFTTQINANTLHLVAQNGSVVLINSSYFINSRIHYIPVYINSTYNNLVSSTKDSINYLYYAFILLVIFLIFNILVIYGFFDSILHFSTKTFLNKLIVNFSILCIITLIFGVIYMNKVAYIISVVLFIIIFIIVAYKVFCPRKAKRRRYQY